MSSSIIDFPPPSLSLKTFSRFFHDSAWMSAIASSFIIALIVMVVAVIVGTLAAIGLSGSKFRGRGLIVGLILMPLAVPVVVLGLGDFAFLARLGKWFTGIQLVGTRTGIALSQSVLAVPYVFIVMSASLAGLNPQLVRSAQSLGAGTIALFRHVYFPVVKMGLIASALFAFISASSFVLTGRHGLSPQVYGMCFGIVVAGYLIGSVASGRLVRRLGSDGLLARGAGLGAVAGVSMAVLEFSGVHGVAAILAPMFFCTVATGLVMPNAIARALAPYPTMAGSASALMGFVQMTMAACVGIAVGHALAAGAQALAAAVALCSVLALLSYLALIRVRRAPGGPAV